jgi:hypothetical protein
MEKGIHSHSLQVHCGAKDVDFHASRARILPLTVLAGILKI